MQDKVEITIDGKPFEADKGSVLLDAFQDMGIPVPTLCHHPSLEPSGSCRLCVVEITHPDWNGWSGLVTSCNYPVEPKLEVSTTSNKVKEMRRTLLELYLAQHPEAEELKSLAKEEGLGENPFPQKEGADKCVLCGLCTRVCQDLGPAAIAPLNRGSEKSVGPKPDHVGEDCTGCGACALLCPTGEIQMEQKEGKVHIWNRTFEIPLCTVKPELCRGPDCGECRKVCPLEIPKFIPSDTGALVSYIDPSKCTGCGICAGACPRGTIEQKDCPDSRLNGMELDSKDLKGHTVVFACSRSPLPLETQDVIQVSCIGRVSMENMLGCLARGADGVLLMCRDQATCPHGRGGELAMENAAMADLQAYTGGLGKDRIQYVKPRPGFEGPKEALDAFKAGLEKSPLERTYAGSKKDQAGMDHALEIREWFKDQPELVPDRGLSKRRITQMISLVLLHSSFWDWAQLKWFCNPVLSCHSCALAWFACPVGVFVHYSGYHLFPYIALGTILFLGVLLGRLLCGWICPFGFLQDLLYKIPTIKIVLPKWTSNVKYIVLILGVFLLPFFLGEQTAFSFCRICPAAALQSTLPNLISSGVEALQTLVVIKLAFLVIFIIFVTLSNRAFCKVICPIGAMLAPFNLISFWKIKLPIKPCMSCDWCDKVCPPNGAPSSRISAGVSASRTLDCVMCYECKQECPKQGVVEVDLKKGGKRRKMFKKFFLVILFLLPASIAFGIEVPLKYERFTSSDSIKFPYIFTSLEKNISPPSGDWNLPELKSEYPIYAFVDLGEEKRLLVVDSKSSEDVFYNQIFFDANGNKDLTDDAVISEDPPNEEEEILHGYSIMDVPMALKGTTTPYSFRIKIDYKGRKGKKPSKGSVQRSLKLLKATHCWYKGDVDLDGHKYYLCLADLNNNSRFDDTATPPDLSNLAPLAKVNLEGDGLYISSTPDIDVSYVVYFSDYLVLRGKTFQSDLNLAKGFLSLLPLSKDLAKLKFSMELEQAGFYSTGAGKTILMHRPEKEVMVPPGQFQLYSYRVIKKDGQGDLWALTASATKETPVFDIDMGEEQCLEVGEPYATFASVPDWSIDGIRKGFSKQASIEFYIEGKAKERVIDFLRIFGENTQISLSKENKNRPAEPFFKVIGKDGEEITNGHFKYG